MGPVLGANSRHLPAASMREEYGYAKLKQAGRKLKKVMTSSMAKETGYSGGNYTSYDESPMNGPWDTSSLEEEFQLEQILGKNGVSAPDDESS